MKKKILAILLAALTVGGMFAGCGGGDKEIAAGDEPYTVTMVLTGTQQKEEERIEEKINEILVPAINMKLDLVVLPWGSSKQQLQLMLSGDEKIDCFYTGVDYALQYMKSGQIMDMTELVDKYGTNLKEIFGEEALASLSVNGFTYGVPAHCEGASLPAVFLRKDLVEKYNIDVSQIKKPEDLEPIFDTVLAGEPDLRMLFSNGSTNGPLYRLGLSAYDALGNGFGVLMNPTENTTVENLYESDWYRDTANLLYKWYQKGYINKDAATENESWNSLFKAGKVFAMFTGDHPGILSELESSTGYEFAYADFDDLAVKKSNYYSDIIYSIAQNSEDPEKTMQCLDYIYGSEDVMNLLNWGEEGIDYVYVDKENNLINYPDGINTENVGYSMNLGWELPNQYLTHLWEGSDPNVYEETEKFNEKGVPSKALGFTFDNTGLDTQLAAVNNVYNQYAPSLGAGTVDPEEYIPKFIKDLKAAGIDDIIAEKQKQLDAWLAEQ